MTSILGLNDFIHCNSKLTSNHTFKLDPTKTIKCLHNLPEEEQEQVMDIKKVQEGCKAQTDELRRRNMMQAHIRR